MGRRGHTPEQIITALREAEVGVATRPSAASPAGATAGAGLEAVPGGAAVRNATRAPACSIVMPRLGMGI